MQCLSIPLRPLVCEGKFIVFFDPGIKILAKTAARKDLVKTQSNRWNNILELEPRIRNVEKNIPLTSTRFIWHDWFKSYPGVKLRWFFHGVLAMGGSVTNGTFPSCLLGIQAKTTDYLWSFWILKESESVLTSAEICSTPFFVHYILSETCLFPNIYISFHYILDTGRQYHPSLCPIWKTPVSPSLEN